MPFLTSLRRTGSGLSQTSLLQAICPRFLCFLYFTGYSCLCAADEGLFPVNAASFFERSSM
jgi:hypothetical protein